MHLRPLRSQAMPGVGQVVFHVRGHQTHFRQFRLCPDAISGRCASGFNPPFDRGNGLLCHADRFLRNLVALLEFQVVEKQASRGSYRIQTPDFRLGLQGRDAGPGSFYVVSTLAALEHPAQTQRRLRPLDAAAAARPEDILHLQSELRTGFDLRLRNAPLPGLHLIAERYQNRVMGQCSLDCLFQPKIFVACRCAPLGDEKQAEGGQPVPHLSATVDCTPHTQLSPAPQGAFVQ